MTDTTNLEQRVRGGKDYRTLARTIIGAGIAVGGTLAAGVLYAADPTGVKGIYDTTFGDAIRKAPLPLLGPAAAITFGYGSRDEATREDEPVLGPVKGILYGTLINAATSGFKLLLKHGQYDSKAPFESASNLQFLQDMVASVTILGLVYAATTGVMNACEAYVRGKRNRVRKREARRRRAAEPIEAHQEQP